MIHRPIISTTLTFISTLSFHLSNPQLASSSSSSSSSQRERNLSLISTKKLFTKPISISKVMIEELTDSRKRCKIVDDKILAMEVSKSGVRRSRDGEVTSSGAGNGKRKKFSSQEINAYDQSRRDDVSTTVSASATSDHHGSSFMCFRKDDFRPDLKSQAECISETEAFMSSNDGFSGETSVSSEICLESEEMESVSTSTPKKKKNPAPANEATSRRKPSPSPAAKAPSAAELEEFFSEAEKYEKKRFADKYNYDIVKDAPMEGRYQWVRLKP